jgi:hypothetical protein
MGKLKNYLIDQMPEGNKMIITPASNATGTSLQGHIETDYEELVKVFGKPQYGPNSEYHDKVTCEWCLWIEGSLVTIYDYKEDKTPMGTYSWHIGGKNKEAAELVYDAFFQSKEI